MKSFAEFTTYCKGKKIPPFRVKQLFQAIYKEGRGSYDEISTLPKELRDAFSLDMPILSFTKVNEVKSKSDDTVKTLFKLHDGALVEGVLMRFQDGRNSVCISSQVGCGLKCAFCATGTMGFTRNLTAEEIADQVLYFDQYLKKNNLLITLIGARVAPSKPAEPDLEPPPLARYPRYKKNNLLLTPRVDHVIFMGMGEPFLNYDNVLESIRRLNDPVGLNIAARHITVSTSGVVPSIRKFADFPLQVNLALSIHAANQKLRAELMPIAKAYPLDQLIAAINDYVEKTNRRISYEYVMLKDKNDSPERARELGKLIRGQKAHVNLIPYNQTYLGFSNAGKSRIDRFREILESYDIPVTVRVSLGQDISAACGQLAVDEKKQT